MMDKHYNKLRIGQATIDMTDSMKVFEEYKQNCKHSWHFQRGDLSYHDVGYDYCPVLFSFQQTATATTATADSDISSDDNASNNSGISSGINNNDNKLLFHVIGIHGSVGDVTAAAGGRNKTYSVPEQNIVEMLYLQNLCTMAVEKNELIILLGDFNTQERSNGTMGLWDRNLNLPVVSKKEWKYREEEYLRDSRDGFLDYYTRAIRSCFPTNVFPFLAGLTSIPKHNDDIWIPNTNTQGWSLKSGKCLEIDDFVLKAWDRKTQQFYEESKLLEFSAVGINDDDDEDQDIVKADYRIQLAKEKIVEISHIEITQDNKEHIQTEIADAKSRLADEMKRRKQLDNPSESQLRKATTINQKLVEIWSDHRPIVASIKIVPESDSNT